MSPTVQYYGFCAIAHRGKVRKASLFPSVLRMAEQEEQCLPSKGWKEMKPRDSSHAPR